MKETSGKVPPFAPLGDPQRRDPIGRPELASTDPSCCPKRETSSVLQQREGDEVSPAASCARRARSCSTGRETSGGPQLGEDQPFDGSSAQMTRRWGEGRDGPNADEPTPEKPAAAANRSVELLWSHHDAGRPSPRPPHAAAHDRSSGHARPLPYRRRPMTSKYRSRRTRTTGATRR